MKKLSCFILALTMAVVLCASAVSASEGLGNFTASVQYTEGQFTDVVPGEWYAQYVASAYRFGLMNGSSAKRFNINGNVTIAETITLAVRLCNIYYTGTCTIENGNPWYSPYVEFAFEHGIIKEKYQDVNRPATRAEYATIIGAALPDDALMAINDIPSGSIPDVPDSRSYAPDVYRLYRAGILTGSDSKGNFNPNSNIRRSEVAAIISRIADKTQRREFSLVSSAPLDAVAISEKCSDAVFFISVYDHEGAVIRTGSGFFIDSDGTAVTNFHVINGAAHIAIETANRHRIDVDGIYAFSEEDDIAILKISDVYAPYPYLERNTGSLSAGQKIYAIGSPQGFSNSISDGIISNPYRALDSKIYIQFTAPISSGSSGGALINERGEVIGISSATVTAGANDAVQNINLAIPIGRIDLLDIGAPRPLSDIFEQPKGSLTILHSQELVCPLGETIEVVVNHTPEDDITIVYELLDGSEQFVECEWGEFSDSTPSIPLYVKGLQEGLSFIKITLYNYGKTEVYAEEYIAVTVTDSSLTVSDSAPVVKAGKDTVITFYADPGMLQCNYFITYSADKDGLFGCIWGDWNGGEIPLTIHGLKRGTSKLYIYLVTESEQILARGYITVTVE